MEKVITNLLLIGVGRAFQSKNYQWLPSEFFVDEKGGVTIESYINNLHPDDHKELYGTIGRVFEQFVPLFEHVLVDAVHPRGDRVDVDPNWYSNQPEPKYDENLSLIHI